MKAAPLKSDQLEEVHNNHGNHTVVKYDADGQPLYEFHDFVDVRYDKNGKLELQIHWSGYDRDYDQTWYPEACVNDYAKPWIHFAVTRKYKDGSDAHLARAVARIEGGAEIVLTPETAKKAAHKQTQST